MPKPSGPGTSAALTCAAVIAAATSRIEAPGSTNSGERRTSVPSRVMLSSGRACAVWPVMTSRRRRLLAT